MIRIQKKNQKAKCKNSAMNDKSIFCPRKKLSLFKNRKYYIDWYWTGNDEKQTCENIWV